MTTAIVQRKTFMLKKIEKKLKAVAVNWMDLNLFSDNGDHFTQKKVTFLGYLMG